MQKQAFLGTAVGGALIGQITNAIIDNLIRAPSVPVSRENSGVVKPEVREAVAQEVGPVIDHLTNNEPFYRSRVWWGSVGSILGGAATIITMAVNGVPLSFESYGPPAGAIWGGATALWGRYGAHKPIGA
jgi:hypothetical protein